MLYLKVAADANSNDGISRTYWPYFEVVN